jgi:AcrR family transcriptional regulator
MDRVRVDAGATFMASPFEKLKPGPGLPPEVVAESQRHRLHWAVLSVVGKYGWGGVQVRSVTRAAGVSTSTFYKHFRNADSCLASAIDSTMGNAVTRSSAAQRGRFEWRDALLVAVSSLMAHLAADPNGSRVVLLDVYSAGPASQRCAGQVVTRLERLIASVIQGAPQPATLPRHLVAGMSGGFLHVARTEVAAGRGMKLMNLAPEVGEWMVSLSDPRISLLLDLEMRNPSRVGDLLNESGQTVQSGLGRGTREVLLRSVIRLAAEEGFRDLTESYVSAKAGISRRRFNATFSSVQECFLAGIETAASEAAARALARSSNDLNWVARTATVVFGLCAEAADDSRLARAALVEILASGREGLLVQERLISIMAKVVRSTVPTDQRPSALVAEASVAAAWHVAQGDTAAGRSGQLRQVAPLLSYIVLCPIVGPSVALEAIGKAAT